MTLLRVLLCAGLLLGPAVPMAMAMAAQPQPSVDEFVPVDEAPPGEQIPAITLVAAAYGFVFVVLLGYVWSVARRLHKVEAELADLESRRK